MPRTITLIHFILSIHLNWNWKNPKVRSRISIINSKTMKHKYIYILSFVAIVAIIVLKLATNKSAINEKKQASVTAEVAIPVKVAQAALQEIEMKLVKTGSLTPFREGNVLTAVAGTVQKINFQLGSEVKAGQVLALSDTKLLKLDLHKAELTAKNLARDLQTYVDLAKVGAATVEK
ncbi:MAG: biotin/lipoyl-binding protein, partial [Chitinophagaceae bacterium]